MFLNVSFFTAPRQRIFFRACECGTTTVKGIRFAVTARSSPPPPPLPPPRSSRVSGRVFKAPRVSRLRTLVLIRTRLCLLREAGAHARLPRLLARSLLSFFFLFPCRSSHTRSMQSPSIGTRSIVPIARDASERRMRAGEARALSSAICNER